MNGQNFQRDMNGRQGSVIFRPFGFSTMWNSSWILDTGQIINDFLIIYVSLTQCQWWRITVSRLKDFAQWNVFSKTLLLKGIWPGLAVGVPSNTGFSGRVVHRSDSKERNWKFPQYYEWDVVGTFILAVKAVSWYMKWVKIEIWL